MRAWFRGSSHDDNRHKEVFHNLGREGIKSTGFGSRLDVEGRKL